MTISVSGSLITFNDGSTQNTSAYGGGFAMRNRIINGAMMIDQRNAGASVTPTANQFSADRWSCQLSAASKYSAQQSSTAPAGFTNSIKITSLSSYSVGAGDYFFLQQGIEGYNVADFGLGASGAATFTISFWVQSSLTGTFGGNLQNGTGRYYPFNYTISSANTWEQKTITVVGDTTGTWGKTNGAGLYIGFAFGVGSTYSGTAGSWSSTTYFSSTGATSLVGTNGATFYITGVQLEKGSTATSFDYRPYGTELMLCQRYCPAWSFSGSYTSVAGGFTPSTSQCSALLPYPVTPRVPATGITTTGTFTGITNTYGVGGTGTLAISAYGNTNNLGLVLTGSSGLTVGAGSFIACVSTGTLIATGCEL